MQTFLFLNSREGQYNTGNGTERWEIRNYRFEMVEEFDIALISIQFPNSVYPTNTWNNIIVFKQNNGTTYTATIPPGYYTGPNMAAAVQTAMNAAGTLTFTATYDSNMKKMTVSAAGGTFYFIASDNSALGDLGYVTLEATLAASKVSDYPINISGTKYIDVFSNFVTNNHSSTSSGNILERVPVYGGFGEEIFYEVQSHQAMRIQFGKTNHIEITLKDDRGNAFLLPPNVQFSVKFSLIAHGPREFVHSGRDVINPKEDHPLYQGAYHPQTHDGATSFKLPKPTLKPRVVVSQDKRPLAFAPPRFYAQEDDLNADMRLPPGRMQLEPGLEIGAKRGREEEQESLQ